MPSTGQGSKQERVYSILRSRILDGTYPPGYRLVIDTIRHELKVSPMPIREAIRRLEAEHWIVYRPHSGAQVAQPDPRTWEEAAETLAILEGYVTARAAMYIEPADLERLRELNAQMAEDFDAADVIAFNSHNEDWHRVIWDRCPNKMLRREVETAQDRLNVHRDSMYLQIVARGRIAMEEHARLAEMLESKEGEDAIERFARAHKLLSIDAVVRRRDDGARDLAG
jgi:DNA-binding GntR family transcriptional regulator